MTGTTLPSTVRPAWMDWMTSGGHRITNSWFMDISHDGTGNLSSPQACLMPGEQIAGGVVVDSQWTDEAGANVGDPTGVAPGTPLSAVLYPADQTPTSSGAVQVEFVHFKPAPLDGCVFRLLSEQWGRPRAGWRVRVEVTPAVPGTSPAVYIYNTLQADMPIATVLFPDQQTVSGVTRVHLDLQQGVFGTLGAGDVSVVGTESKVTGQVIGIGAVQFGQQMQPDSRQTLVFTVKADFTSGAPTIGEEIVCIPDASKRIGAGLVEGYDAATRTVTVKSYWGDWSKDTPVLIVGRDPVSTAEIDAQGSRQDRSPSWSMLTIFDGRYHPVIGGRSGITITCNAGESPNIAFDVSGQYKKPSVAEMPELSIADDTPLVWEDGYFFADGMQIRCESMSFQTSPQNDVVPDANSPGGTIGTNQSTRTPQITFTVGTAGASRETGGDWEDARDTGKPYRIVMVFKSGSRRCALVLPNVQITDVALEGDSLLNSRVTGACNLMTTDNDYYLTIF